MFFFARCFLVAQAVFFLRDASLSLTQCFDSEEMHLGST